ncbi:hypothetical protein K438DRAFT_2029606 [Mycena galopus ATCC 62051]|nr:hypothetical protein K438DRAFT_2029606 [Mycena galopus ATCC 62051]
MSISRTDVESGQGIHSLPAELICAIFSFNHASRSPSDQKPSVLSPVHILTRVCRIWREISQGLPELWTDIRIFHCRSGISEMLDQHLRRSSNLRLDMLLDLPFKIAGKQFTEFWGLVLKIWSVAYRWRSLGIVTTADNFSYIRDNVGCKAVPQLEFLRLCLSGDSFSAHNSPAISFSSMFALKSLVLRGITLDHCEVSSFVNQLEHLDLFATSATILSQLAGHFDAASGDTQAISRLRYLSLRTTVQFDVASDDLRSLFNALRAPVLEELSFIDLSTTCWNNFTTALFSQSVVFPSLRTLKLSSVHGCTMHDYLGLAFPSLENLSLLYVDCSTFLSALSKAEPTLWPRLHSLALNETTYRALRSVVEARITLKCPLTCLEMDTPRFIDTSSLQWLQNHVKTLKRNVQAA